MIHISKLKAGDKLIFNQDVTWEVKLINKNDASFFDALYDSNSVWEVNEDI